MNAYNYYRSLLQRLSQYEEKESIAVVFMILEHFLKLKKEDVLAKKELKIENRSLDEIDGAINRLNHGEPIQYVIGSADFYGRRFLVNPSVLIPRNETEELVQWVIRDFMERPVRILDIGTGTGCIAITLRCELPGAEVIATDINQDIIKIARENSRLNKAEVQYFVHDLFSEPPFSEPVDVMVSNPPYVLYQEQSAMSVRVLRYEPHQALFVPDDDPLKYYIGMLELSKSILKPKGSIYFEINESQATPMEEMLLRYQFNSITIRQDIRGKDRLVYARKP